MRALLWLALLLLLAVNVVWAPLTALGLLCWWRMREEVA